jgi:hypothetical protein
MIAEKQLRGIVILIGLCVVGCAPFVERFEPTASSAHPIPVPGCPYASVYAAVSANGLEKEGRVAERVRLAYSRFLGQQGFTVVATPEEAYWSSFSMVRLSRRTDSTFAWAAYVMATQDVEGRIQGPVRFAGEGERATELSGFMLLREVRLLELDLQAQRAAADTAGALLPHTFRMCLAWSTQASEEVVSHVEGPPNGVGPEGGDSTRRLRDELRREMRRVRRQRAERPQKRLEIEVEDRSES